MGYQNIDGLMQHLRENGIDISGDVHKQQLRNTGYFHGYKGYRFYGNSSCRIPFTKYEEIYATIQYDSNLKSLIYGSMMFIETSVKNRSLECILNYVQSETIQDMYDKAVNSYKTCPTFYTPEQKKKIQQNKLNLESRIQTCLINAYRHENPIVSHFYNNVCYSGVPLWALFEILTLGDFGFLLSCLKYEVRDYISRSIGLNLSADTNRQLIYKYIFALKDLRNAIAHNSVIFDARFRNFDCSRAMKRCLEQEVGLSYINFKSIGDYIILICYFLKLFQAPETEILTMISNFENITFEYQGKVSHSVSNIVTRSDLSCRMTALRKYIYI